MVHCRKGTLPQRFTASGQSRAPSRSMCPCPATCPHASPARLEGPLPAPPSPSPYMPRRPDGPAQYLSGPVRSQGAARGRKDATSASRAVSHPARPASVRPYRGGASAARPAASPSAARGAVRVAYRAAACRAAALAASPSAARGERPGLGGEALSRRPTPHSLRGGEAAPRGGGRGRSRIQRRPRWRARGVVLSRHEAIKARCLSMSLHVIKAPCLRVKAAIWGGARSRSAAMVGHSRSRNPVPGRSWSVHGDRPWITGS